MVVSVRAIAVKEAIPYVISMRPLRYACIIFGSRHNRDVMGVATFVMNWKKPTFVSKLINIEKKIIYPAMFVMIETEDMMALVNMRLKLCCGVDAGDDNEVR